MGVVAKEAGKSGIALVLGLAVGTVNTILVLPRAFDGAEEYWGLIRVLTAWSNIIAPVLMFGGSGILIRQSRALPDRLRGALNTSVWLIAATGLVLWSALMFWNGEELLSRFDAEKGGLITGHLGMFLLMNALVIINNLSNSMLIIELKGSGTTWVTEIWLKTSYLILAFCLLSGWIDLEMMVNAYVGTWIVSSLMMLVLVRKSQNPIRFNFLREINWKENLRYGGYASMTSGASVIATNLDFVMVGALLGLSVVPVYTMGFFIGSVVMMPLRALNSVFSGIVAKKINESGPQGMQPFIQQHSRVALLLTTTLFAGVLAGLNPLISALPKAYVGIAGITIAIAVQKILQAASSSASNIIGHTSFYRLNLPINLGMLLATVATNWLFMSVLGWGVDGAALATLFTAVWNTSWQLYLLRKKIGIHPFTPSWIAIFCIGGAVGLTGYLMPNWWNNHGYIEAGLRGIIGASLVMGIAYFTGIFPELRTAIKQRSFKVIK